MYLKVLLYYLRSNSLYQILSFVIKMGYIPLIKAHFFLQILTDKIFSKVAY